MWVFFVQPMGQSEDGTMVGKKAFADNRQMKSPQKKALFLP